MTERYELHEDHPCAATHWCVKRRRKCVVSISGQRLPDLRFLEQEPKENAHAENERRKKLQEVYGRGVLAMLWSFRGPDRSNKAPPKRADRDSKSSEPELSEKSAVGYQPPFDLPDCKGYWDEFLHRREALLRDPIARQVLNNMQNYYDARMVNTDDLEVPGSDDEMTSQEV
jgi:hypothetical protein